MNTNHTNFVHRSVNIAPRPEGANLHGNQGSTANEYPAPDESERVLHTSRAELVTSPAIKDGKVYSCDRLVEGCQITR